MKDESEAGRLRSIAEQRQADRATQDASDFKKERDAWLRLRDELGPVERQAVLDAVLKRCRAAADRGGTALVYRFKICEAFTERAVLPKGMDGEARKNANWTLFERTPSGRWVLGVHGEWLLQQLREKGFRLEFAEGGLAWGGRGIALAGPVLAVEW